MKMAPTKKKKEVVNATIKSRVFSRSTDSKGNVTSKSTRGYKIKARAGDKTVTNKLGEKVVVRKNGNRVVTKKDGTVVRKKASGDKVITTSRMKPTPRATGPSVGPRTYQRSPRSTMEGTVTGREGLTETPASGYGQGMPKPGKKKVRPTPKPGVKPKLGGR